MRVNNITVEGDYTVRQKPLVTPGGGRRINGMTVYGDVSQKLPAVTRSGRTGAVISNTPKSVQSVPDSNGITAPANIRRAQKPPYNPEGNTYGGRAVMRAAGLSDSDIGYDGQYVTYKGNKMFIPSSVENGTAYAPKSTIYAAVNNAYKNDGTPLVQVNRYQNKYGITDGYGYNDKTGEVTLGGAPIDYAYIDEDGNAWAREDVLSSAYDRYAGELGIREPGYYKKEYDRELRAAQSGGGLSSSALAAAGAAQNEYMQQLSDRVPQIAQYAYERFLNGEQADIAEQAQRRQDALSRYSAGYAENSDLLDRQKAEREAAYDRFLKDLALKKEREDLGQLAYENLFKRGQLAGSFTEEEKARAGAQNPYAGEMAYNLFVKQPQYEYERSRDDYYDEQKGNRDFEHDKDLLGIQSDNDLAKIEAQHKNDKELVGVEQWYKKGDPVSDLAYDIIREQYSKTAAPNTSDPIMQWALKYVGAEGDRNKQQSLRQQLNNMDELLSLAYGEGK